MREYDVRNFGKVLVRWGGVAIVVFVFILAARWSLTHYIDQRIDYYLASRGVSLKVGNSDRRTKPIRNLSSSDIERLNKIGISLDEKKDEASSLFVFSDYLCSYCKAAERSIGQKYRDKTEAMNIIYIEYPILSPDSLALAEIALVANSKGLYKEYRQKILGLSHPGEKDGVEFLQKQGMTLASIEKSRSDKSIQHRISESLKLGKDLQISGTPAIIANGTLISGWNEREFQAAL